MVPTREVLVMVPVADGALSGIAVVDRCVHVVDARGRFDVELRETWPAWTVQRYLGERAGSTSSREERDHLLAGAEIISVAFRFRSISERGRRACAGSDVRQHRGIDLFRDNLRAYLDGRPLTNVVDWAEGY